MALVSFMNATGFHFSSPHGQIDVSANREVARTALGYASTVDTLPPRKPETPLADEQRALATVCAHYLAVFVLAAGLLKWAVTRTTGELTFNLADQTAIATVVGALVLGTSARQGLISRERCVAIAPWLLVIGALAIAVVEQLQPWPAGAMFVGISWVCLWIVGYPNAGPRIDGSLPVILAATMGPFVLSVGMLTDVLEFPGIAQAALFFAPAYIAAAAVTLRVEKIVTQRAEDRIGSFRLVEQMGGGGMGEVWKAEHRMLATPAAVKLILPAALANGGKRAGLEERFRREAQATSELRSPHTVRLFDFGLDRDGRYFYVMELLDGVDLDFLVKRFGPVPPERCVHLLRQACLSLGEAHGRGMVHRDIKPANLLVSRLGLEVDFVKVVDFGLVAISDAPEDADAEITGAEATNSRLTAVGTIAGTPAYIAPETVLTAEIDHRADLYALGAVAVWLLTGEMVFQGGAIQVMQAHVHDEPIPPSQRTDLPIPEDLEALVLECLRKDPAKRPQTAEELLLRLEACECAGGWTGDRARTWWARHLP